MAKFNENAFRSRADRVRQSNPLMPDYSSLGLRPGAHDYKKHASVSSSECFTSKKSTERYTGDQIIGIGTMHKSNTVPITKSSNMAKDIAKMRR